jgi:short-subunit dehydrogenase
VGGAMVTAVQCDLSSADGMGKLRRAVARAARPVEVLIATAGRRSGRAFLDQSIHEALKIVHTYVDGTIQLIHELGQSMRRRGRGRILIAGSMAGLLPGAFQAICSASEAFMVSFSETLSHELKGSGINVSCLMPAVSGTHFLESVRVMTNTRGVERALDCGSGDTGDDALTPPPAPALPRARRKIPRAPAGSRFRLPGQPRLVALPETMLTL